ncbi:MAG: PKD domain-containing protein [Salinivirgaceae bacterium]
MKNEILSLLCLSIVLFGCVKENTETPEACFTYISSYNGYDGPVPYSDTVMFENCSTQATSYLWDFGDSTTSTETNPMHIFTQMLPAIVSLTAINGNETDVLTDTIYDWAIVYKPNIYLYPKENSNICVSLNFPKGGDVIASIPEYRNGWCVNVAIDGKIDGEFDYLFYESAQPNIWQRTNGWCIEQNKLETFFKTDMENRGFTQNEIDDFTEYWIPLMKEYPFYTIFPQTKETINRVIKVDFSVQPDIFYRLFYCIEGIQTNVTLEEPVIHSFSRNGFTAVEWGVVMD